MVSRRSEDTLAYSTHFVKVCPNVDILINLCWLNSFKDLKVNYGLTCIENPRHKQHMENFFRKFPTADRERTFAIIKVDPKYWYISDDLKLNTASCCQACSISEDSSNGVKDVLWYGSFMEYERL
jgi:hypothetical protein